MENEQMKGRLYVVATPLGNLEDITLRARRVLGEVALVLCEDTRRTAKLLKVNNIDVPTLSFHEHNAKRRTPQVLRHLSAGDELALVSDAGTPTISDPGAALVMTLRREGHVVIPIPGPSAVATALSVSGLPADRYVFRGFLPGRAGERRRALVELTDVTETLVFFESPRRIRATLADLEQILGDRSAFVCREATKRHEEYAAGTLAELARSFADRDVKGEITLVVAGASGEPRPSDAPVEQLFEELRGQGLTRRAAAKETARRTGGKAREIYARMLANGGGDDSG